jgi:nucleotide-binding universal stress UspA family protein
MVIVGYNGAADALPALLWAAEEAARRGTPLRVLNAVNVQGVLTGPGGDQGVVTPEATEAADQALRDAQDKVAHIEGLTVETSVVFGSPAAVLVEAAQEDDLVVVGNRGRGELASAVLGSVAYAVMSHAKCPVVVVRGDGTWNVTAGHKIVVGIDGSEAGHRAMEFAAATAVRSKSTLLLLTAWQPVGGAGLSVQPWQVITTATAEADERARELADLAALGTSLTARYPGLTVTQEVVEGRPADVIAAASKEAGLVVIGTRGRGGFKGLLLGSVSHDVIHEVSCPVAVVR